MLRSLFVFSMVLLPMGLLAQDPRGTILGRVVDASGSPVPNVMLKNISVSKGLTVTSTSNEAGDYRAPYLNPGAYNVEAEASGFAKLIRRDVQVRTTETVTLDLEMKVGQVSESVEIRAETPLLNAADVSLGQVIDQRRIEELPLFAGNAMDLVHLAPGTVNGTNLRLRKAPFNNAPSTFGTNGGGNYNNDFTMDGVVNVYSDGTQPRVAFSPPQTAIGEFKVQTSAFDASAGFSLGSNVNATTKSGSNAFHGELDEWLRHSKLDVPTIFQNRAGQKLPLNQDNRFGGSIGGPVRLPKIYDGKNRTHRPRFQRESSHLLPVPPGLLAGRQEPILRTRQHHGHHFEPRQPWRSARRRVCHQADAVGKRPLWVNPAGISRTPCIARVRSGEPRLFEQSGELN